MYKHGHCTRKAKRSPEFNSWRAIFDRCRNPNNKRYKDYGARGIDISQEWETFEKFLADMGLKPTFRHSIERLDVDKGYSKENCIWATARDQNRNRRNNHSITYQGQTKLLVEWSEELGIGHTTLLWRLKRWSIEKALGTPISTSSGKKLWKNNI